MPSPAVRALLLLVLAVPVPAGAAPPSVDRFEVSWPARRLWVGASDVEGIELRAVDAAGRTVEGYAGVVRTEGLGLTSSVTASAGVVKLPGANIAAPEVVLCDGTVSTRVPVPMMDGFWTLLPALIAVLLALTTREVLLSLFGGVLIGAGLLYRGFWEAFPRSLDLVVSVAADRDKLKIIIFTMLMGGLVGMIGSNGGTAGIVATLARWAKGTRSGAIVTWFMGMVVFFDDYASSLLVGTTMRPITDRLRISRDKLAYIVDSTAAPITSLALISTWIGYEVSVLGDALRASGIDRDPYEVFIAGMGSRFYQIFALVFVVIVAVLGRDFGPMLTSERRARREGKVLRDGAAPLMDAAHTEEVDRLKAAAPRWWLAALPLVSLVGTVIAVLFTTGMAAADADPAGYAAAAAHGLTRRLGYILSNAASYDALVYAGALSASFAFLLSIGTGSLSMKSALEAFGRGMRAMTLALAVLCLAWSIGKVMQDLHAGSFVAGLIGGQLPAWSLGVVSFSMAAVIAFATGTSWGTMAILFPIVVPVAALHAGSPGFESVLLGATSAVLAGAVFGDHCSPISDTTVLSSIASAADHVDHTRTQAPYALLCGAVAIVLGYLPFGLGVPAWISIILGLAALAAVLRFVGRRPEDY